MQQIKKKQEGPLKPKSVFAWWNRFPLQEIEKTLFDSHTHERVMHIISAGLLEFAPDYSHPVCSFCWNVLG